MNIYNIYCGSVAKGLFHVRTLVRRLQSDFKSHIKHVRTVQSDLNSHVNTAPEVKHGVSH